MLIACLNRLSLREHANRHACEASNMSVTACARGVPGRDGVTGKVPLAAS